MQIIDLVMIPGLDKYSGAFVHDLKICLVGKTPEVGLKNLGIIGFSLGES